MWLSKSLILPMLGLGLLACQAPAPSISPEPVSAPNAEALNSQGNTARDNKDYAEAMRLYRQAAAIGDAAAMNHIGRLYQNGWGVAADYGEAMRWYRLAAEKGDAAAMDIAVELPELQMGIAGMLAEQRALECGVIARDHGKTV